jgi:hypothetical protein
MEIDRNKLSLIKYLEEQKPVNWYAANLPEFPKTIPTVCLTRDQLVRFRNQFSFAMNFIGYIIGVDPEKISSGDMLKYLYQMGANQKEIDRFFPSEQPYPDFYE